MIGALAIGAKAHVYGSGTVLYDGDSITAGLFLTTAQRWPDQCNTALTAAGLTYTTYNSGVSSAAVGPSTGEAVTSMLFDVTTEIDARISTGRVKPGHPVSSIAVLFGGTNDLFYGQTEIQTRAHQVAWLSGRRAAGFTTAYVTMLRRGAGMGAPFEANRVVNNAYFRSGAGRGLVDILIDPCDDAAFLNVTTGQFFDEVHPNAIGANIIGATYAAPAIIAYLNNS